jgi:hypothetical protein
MKNYSSSQSCEAQESRKGEYNGTHQLLIYADDIN